MMLTIKNAWRRSPAAALMRCGGCRPLPRRGVGGLSALQIRTFKSISNYPPVKIEVTE